MKKKHKIYRIVSAQRLGLLLMALTVCGGVGNSQRSDGVGEFLLVFAGAASKPPTELAVEAFTAKTGVNGELVFGGSGYILSQMELTKTGDIYFRGSSDFMELAKVKGLVFPETERSVVYLVNAVNGKTGQSPDALIFFLREP